MGSVTSPQGRLPQRVYWVRRGVVVLVALLLVFGIGKLLGGTGSDTAASDSASTSSAQQPASTQQVLPMGPTAVAGGARKKKAVPLVAPSGTCADDEVSVLPSVPRAWAGQPIVIRLQLQGTQPACTFKVSPETLVVKITSGTDRIWSTQDCAKAVREQDVVVRSGVTTTVPVIWSGRRSDQDCTNSPAWALPGFYHVFAAAYGSTPSDVQFEVTKASPRIVTRTPKPTPSPTSTTSATPTASPSASAKPRATARSTPRATARAKASPTAKVAGKGSACGGDTSATSC